MPNDNDLILEITEVTENTQLIQDIDVKSVTFHLHYLV